MVKLTPALSPHSADRKSKHAGLHCKTTNHLCAFRKRHLQVQKSIAFMFDLQVILQIQERTVCDTFKCRIGSRAGVRLAVLVSRELSTAQSVTLVSTGCGPRGPGPEVVDPNPGPGGPQPWTCWTPTLDLVDPNPGPAGPQPWTWWTLTLANKNQGPGGAKARPVVVKPHAPKPGSVGFTPRHEARPSRKTVGTGGAKPEPAPHGKEPWIKG